jgi:acyl-CoA thioesterase-2
LSRTAAAGDDSAVHFATMMTLEQHGPDTWVGRGPRYPWGGLYGGQIVAQALRAAAHTVEPQFGVQSLHAYFIRLGDADEPIRFEVDRLRNGRTFATRRVVARQAVGAILNLDASFQVPEDGPSVQTAALGEVATPESLPTTPWTGVFDRRVVPNGGAPGRSTAWLKMAEPLGDDAVLQACALAYLSDDIPTDAVVAQHPDRPPVGGDGSAFFSASLDHSIWFHGPVTADEWQLQDFTCHGLLSSRGLAVGYVFDRAGRQLATVAQEVLLRSARTRG